MQRYKKIIGIILVVILGIAAIVFMNSANDIENDTETEELQSEKTHSEESMQEARIPELEEGVDVHRLENEIFAVLGPESVAVTTNWSSGSGILWQYNDKELVVITTKHLMEQAESGELELWTGEKIAFSKENIYTSGEEDLAVLKVSCEKKLKLEKGGVSNYLVEEVPEIGSLLWVIDSVYGAGSGIQTCSVASEEIFLEDYGTEMLLLYGEGKSGMSGSPVYDVNGRLVAMTSGMSEDGTTLTAISADKIMVFLESFHFN